MKWRFWAGLSGDRLRIVAALAVIPAGDEIVFPRLRELPDPQAVLAASSAARATDGVAPLGEAFELALTRPGNHRLITADGTPDPAWHARLTAEARGAEAPAALYPALTDGLGEEYRHWIVSEDGLDLNLVIKSNVGDVPALSALAETLRKRLPQGWRIHANGNNLAFLPPWLSKRAAVRYMLDHVRSQNPGRLVLGIGDSWSDAGFLDLCDLAMIPTQAQLWQHIARGHEWIDG